MPPILASVLNDIFLGSAENKPVPPVQLPADELEHDYPVEWWYFVGHLKETTSTDRFAFEMTAARLRPRFLPPLDTCYIAVIDLQQQRYVSADRQSDAAYSPIAGRVHLQFSPPLGQPGPWVIENLAAPSAPVRYHLEGAFQVDREQRGLRLFLEDKVGKPVLLHGNKLDGVLTLFGLDLGYYSRTRLAVTGGLKLDQRDVLIEGDGWMDHEYGTADLPNSRWTFLAIQLDSGDELCVYQVSRKQPPQSGDVYAYLVDSANQVELANSAALTTYGTPWGPSEYPLRNHVVLKFPSGQTFDLKVEPEFDDQRRVPTGRAALPYLTFWEGAAKVLNLSGVPVGRAFLELAGYE